MTYIDTARRMIEDEFPDLDDALRDLYLVLALTLGAATTLQDVHEAWGVVESRKRPDHPSIIPFDDLKPEVQELDRKYAEGIWRVAAKFDQTTFESKV